MAKTLVTPEFRVSYPFVFQPQKSDYKDKNNEDIYEYRIMCIFTKGQDLSALKELAKEAAMEKWGKDPAQWPKPLRDPIRDQSEKAKNTDGKMVLPEPYEAGAFFINLKTRQKPGVVDQALQPIIDTTQFYPGCYARASITAYAYEAKGNKGVAFGLKNIQKTRDGEPLGNTSRPEDDFAPIEVAETSDGGSADSLFS